MLPRFPWRVPRIGLFERGKHYVSLVDPCPQSIGPMLSVLDSSSPKVSHMVAVVKHHDSYVIGIPSWKPFSSKPSLLPRLLLHLTMQALDHPNIPKYCSNPWLWSICGSWRHFSSIIRAKEYISMRHLFLSMYHTILILIPCSESWWSMTTSPRDGGNLAKPDPWSLSPKYLKRFRCMSLGASTTPGGWFVACWYIILWSAWNSSTGALCKWCCGEHEPAGRWGCQV